MECGRVLLEDRLVGKLRLFMTSPLIKVCNFHVRPHKVNKKLLTSSTR